MTKAEKKRIRNDSCNSHRKEMLDNNWGFCVNCMSTENLEIHHIVPLANGGNHIPWNTVTLCRSCHMKAHSRLQRVEDAGHGGRKPAVKPENADKILWDYTHGSIGYKDTLKALGLSERAHIAEQWYYQQYLKDNHIAKVINNVERYLNPRFHNEVKKDHIATLAIITWDDGHETLCFMHEDDWYNKFKGQFKKRVSKK